MRAANKQCDRSAARGEKEVERILLKYKLRTEARKYFKAFKLNKVVSNRVGNFKKLGIFVFKCF